MKNFETAEMLQEIVKIDSQISYIEKELNILNYNTELLTDNLFNLKLAKQQLIQKIKDRGKSTNNSITT